jgi:hypothetical protein
MSNKTSDCCVSALSFLKVCIALVGVLLCPLFGELKPAKNIRVIAALLLFTTTSGTVFGQKQFPSVFEVLAGHLMKLKP